MAATKTRKKATKRTRKSKAKAAKTPRKARSRKGGAEPVKAPRKARESKELPISDSPIAMRVINIPPELWEQAKETANIRNGAARDVIAEAMNAELFALISDLKEMGISGDIQTKRVRASLDERVIEMMHTGRSETGLPGVEILRLCLRRHLAKRGGAK